MDDDVAGDMKNDADVDTYGWWRGHVAAYMATNTNADDDRHCRQLY